MTSFTIRYNQRKLVFVEHIIAACLKVVPFLLYCQLIQFVYLEDALFLGLSSSKNKLCLRDLVRQVVHAL